MLTDSTDEEDAVELRTVDENKLVLTLRLASSSENAVGWTALVWWRPARCRQARPGCDHRGPGLPALPVAVPAELALSGASRQGRVAAPSICFALARILLAAASTVPPCFRHWRRSSPLLPRGEPLASRVSLSGLNKNDFS